MTADVHEPPPQPGQANIAALVLADINARVEAGLQKYGTPLQSFNGRDALMDLYQELIDACMYVRQAIEERDAAQRPVAHPDMQCGSCGDRLVWMSGSYSHEDRYAVESNPKHEHVAWGIQEWGKR